MIFEIDEIPEGGLSFDVLVNKEQLEIDHSDCTLTENVNVKGELSRIDKDVYLKGELYAVLKVTCTRCLNSFLFPVENKIQAHYVPQMVEASPGCEIEVKELDIEKEVYQEGRIDLRNPLRDQILLDVPLISLCNKNCKGICFKCGNDLNLNQCKCQNDKETDPRFAILENLKDKLEIGRKNGSSKEKDI